MLHYETIDPQTLQLLRTLQNIDDLNDFLLIGGTALALQLGHRISIDLDLFSSTDPDLSLIIDQVYSLGKISIVNQSSRIINLFIDNVKVDFVTYRYEFLNPPVVVEGLRLASVEDIAAMKLAAITGRGARKDFIDLFFLLGQFSLPQLFDFYRSKYPDGNSFLVFKSLVYFEDAELEPMPRMIVPIDWEEIKKRIILEVKTHFP